MWNSLVQALAPEGLMLGVLKDILMRKADYDSAASTHRSKELVCLEKVPGGVGGGHPNEA